MLLLIILNILNVVSVHLSSNSDQSEFQKDNYRSKEVADVRRYKDSDRIETVNKNAIPHSGQYVNEKIVQNVKTDTNSMYTDTGQLKDYRNEEKEFDLDVKSNLKQTINVKYNTNSDRYDIHALNQFNKGMIPNVNTYKNPKVNSVQIFMDLPDITVNDLDSDHNIIENFKNRNTNMKTRLNIAPIQSLVFNQYIEHKLHQEIDKNVNSNYIHNKLTNDIIASVNQNMEVNQNVNELFSLALISNYTNSGKETINYADEDIIEYVKVFNSDEEHWGTDETKDESKSYEEQDSILNDISDCDENCSHKKDLENSDIKKIDHEVKALGLDELKHNFFVEDQEFRPIIPKVQFMEKDNTNIYMQIRWSPLVKQEKRVNKSHQRKGKRKPTAWEKYYSNYHENIGIPAAANIHAHESPGSKFAGRRSSTRIVNGLSADVGQFPYLVRFIC